MEPGSQHQARTGRLKECLFLRGLCDHLCSRFMGSKHLWAGLSAISALLALDNAAGFLLHPAGSGRSGKEPRPCYIISLWYWVLECPYCCFTGLHSLMARVLLRVCSCSAHGEPRQGLGRC